MNDKILSGLTKIKDSLGLLTVKLNYKNKEDMQTLGEKYLGCKARVLNDCNEPYSPLINPDIIGTLAILETNDEDNCITITYTDEDISKVSKLDAEKIDNWCWNQNSKKENFDPSVKLCNGYTDEKFLGKLSRHVYEVEVIL
jgi:hypothetical protein